MDNVQAAAKAFRNCRRNHEKSRTVASYLARQYLIGSGVKLPEIAEMMPSIDQLLDEWFAARTADPNFVPNVADLTHLPKIETTVPSEGVDLGNIGIE